jgi:hypothetical protein
MLLGTALNCVVESSFFAILLNSIINGCYWGLKLIFLSLRKLSQDANLMGGFWKAGLACILWRRDKPLPSTGNRTTVPRTPSPSLTRYSDGDVAASNVVCGECKLYLPTPWSGVLIEKLIVPQLVKKCLALYTILVFSTVFTRARRLSLT